MTPIYHITAFGNLPSIAANGGLHSLSAMKTNGMDYTSIAFASVQDKRSRTKVPCGPGGHLHDYVPFYFAPRSPMLYVIHKGTVACSNGQDGIACIVSTVRRVSEAELGFTFTDGHGIMAPLTNFYDDLAHLDKIDWALMKSRYWNDTASDPDRKRRRQAEFLVHGFFPWECVAGIAVNKTSEIVKVRGLLGELGELTDIRAKSDYFY